MAFAGSVKLTQLKNLQPEEIKILNKSYIITAEDFLTLSSLELMDILRCSHAHCLKLLSSVSQSIAPKPQTALSMYSSNVRYLPTSLSRIDRELLGGLPAGTITEIGGPSGCGKTQFCLMLTAIACLPAANGGSDSRRAVFIDTEGSFTAQRLLDIIKGQLQLDTADNETVKRVASRIKVYKELTCASFSKRLKSLDILLASETNVALVVVDSIASLVRKEFDTRTAKGVIDRYHYLSDQATCLKCIAEDFAIPVIVTNQITTQFLPAGSSVESDWLVVTSLGNSWSHCVNTRLVIEYWNGNKRKLSIAKSPAGASVSVIVKIEEKGLVMDWIETNDMKSYTIGNPNSYSLTVRTNVTDTSLLS